MRWLGRPWSLVLGVVFSSLCALAVCRSTLVAWGVALSGALTLVVTAAAKYGIKSRELSVEGRCANRTIGLFWRARKHFGRSFNKDDIYLVLGAKSSGKSSLLRAATDNESVQLEAADAKEPQASLWQADGRYFLEVPSRLLEGSSLRLMRLFLRTLRLLGVSRRIKGVLFVMDGSTVGVVNREPYKRLQQVMALIVQILGARPPTYLMLTRIDAMPGFLETFGTIDDTTRHAPWGFAIDDNEETALTSGHRFDVLMDTLRDFALERMAFAEQRAQKAPLYLFPQYASTLRRGLMQCIETVFGSQSSAVGARFGGAYFVAALPAPSDEGFTTAQDLLSEQPTIPYALTTPQNVPFEWSRALTQGKSLLDTANVMAENSSQASQPQRRDYFVRGFFEEVLPNDAQLYNGVEPPSLWRRLKRSPSHLASASLALVLSVLMGTSFMLQLRHIRLLQQTVAPLGQYHEHGNIADVLQWIAVVQQDEGPQALLARFFGFGIEDARRPLAGLYVRAMQDAVIGPLLHADAQELQALWREHAYTGTAPDGQQAAQAAALLRSHLLLTGPKPVFEPTLAGGEGSWLVETLTNRIALTQAQKQGSPMAQLRHHLRLYVQLVTDQPAWLSKRDHAMVSQTRVVLQRRPLATLLVDALVADVAAHHPSVELQDIVTAVPAPFFGTIFVPAAFTKPGHAHVVRAWLKPENIARAVWIYCEKKPHPAKRLQLYREVHSRYYARYIEAWRAFLTGIRWQDPTNSRSAQAVLASLTRAEPSPHRAIFRVVAQHTQHLAQGSLPVQTDDLISEWRRRLTVSGVDGMQAPGDSADSSLGPYPGDVERAFAPLVAFSGAATQTQKDKEDEAPLAACLEQFTSLQLATEAFLDGADAAPQLQQQLQRSRLTISALVGKASADATTQAILHKLLAMPIDSLTRVLTMGLRAPSLDSWCQEVVQPFHQLSQYYPLNKFGPDASLEDMAAFFHPQTGHLQQFYREHLQDDIKRRGEAFAFDDKLGGVVGRTYRPALLHYLGCGMQTAALLFQGGDAPLPSADFDLRLSMDGDLWEAQLDVADKSVYLRPGQTSTSWMRMRWPDGAQDAAPTILTMVGMGGIKERLEFDGPWALWHFIESGEALTDRSSNKIIAMWQPGGLTGHVRLEIRPTRAIHPFFARSNHHAQPAVFGYLRDPSLWPPSRIGVNAPACP